MVFLRIKRGRLNVRNLIQNFFWLPLFLSLCSCVSSPKPREMNTKTTCERTPAEFFGKPPLAIQTIQGNFFYADSNNSQIDESLYRQNEEARKPLRKYLDQIIKMTELAAAGDGGASLAVNEWLLSWAEGEALTKADSQQAGFERKWLLSGLLIAYLNNKPYSGWKQRNKIESWLNRLTHLMMQDYQSFQRGSQRNNHVYWAGLVAIEMSLVNNDKKLLNWGLEKIRYGLSQIDSDGFLSLELERKSKALHYHRVSLDAFIMAAYLLKDQGLNLLKEQNSALERLAETTLRGMESPERFAQKTGVAQEFKIKDSTGWLAIYLNLKPENSKAAQLLKATPPNWNRALGGRPVELFQSAQESSIRCAGLLKAE